MIWGLTAVIERLAVQQSAYQVSALAPHMLGISCHTKIPSRSAW